MVTAMPDPPDFPDDNGGETYTEPSLEDRRACAHTQWSPVVDDAGRSVPECDGCGYAPEAYRHPVGIFPDVPHAEYHERRVGVVSKSAIVKVARSPLHYKAWIDGAEEEEPTIALAFGSAFHCALLEPERFATAYATEPEFGDCRFKANKETRDAWRAANAGKIALSGDDAAAIAGMVAAVRAHPLAGKMIRDGMPELTVRWVDAETGLPCKSRADYYVERLRMAVDVKTAEDASPEAFAKAVARYTYHWQDALYRAGFAAAGKPIDHFIFPVVEKAPPYAIAVYSLDGEAIAKGHNAVRRHMLTLAECVKTGRFPGYPETIQTLQVPPWSQ